MMNNMDMNRFKNQFVKSFNKLWDKIKGCDRNNLISTITGVIFALLGIIQLISVIATPVARTFDHISLILVDGIIAALCFVYVIYRHGGSGLLTDDSEIRKTTAETENHSSDRNTQPSSASGVSRVYIPSSGIQLGSCGVRSSQAENENLFSPRHRYTNPSSSQSQSNSTSGTEPRPTFNSRRTNG